MIAIAAMRIDPNGNWYTRHQNPAVHMSTVSRKGPNVPAVVFPIAMNTSALLNVKKAAGKAIHLYATQAIADLSRFAVGAANNGLGTE